MEIAPAVCATWVMCLWEFLKQVNKKQRPVLPARGNKFPTNQNNIFPHGFLQTSINTRGIIYRHGQTQPPKYQEMI